MQAESHTCRTDCYRKPFVVEIVVSRSGRRHCWLVGLKRSGVQIPPGQRCFEVLAPLAPLGATLLEWGCNGLVVSAQLDSQLSDLGQNLYRGRGCSLNKVLGLTFGWGLN